MNARTERRLYRLAGTTLVLAAMAVAVLRILGVFGEPDLTNGLSMIGIPGMGAIGALLLVWNAPEEPHRPRKPRPRTQAVRVHDDTDWVAVDQLKG